MLRQHLDKLLVRFSFYRRRGNADNNVIRVDLLDFILTGVGFYLYTDLHNFQTSQLPNILIPLLSPSFSATLHGITPMFFG